MKHKYITILLVLLLLFVFGGCKGNRSSGSPGEANFDRDASYALGMNIGMSITGDGIIPDFDELLKGMKDGAAGNTRMDIQEAMAAVEAAYYGMMEQRNSGAIQDETLFLAENSLKPSVITTGSGLQYEVISEGVGPKPIETDIVQVHYEGRLTDGTVFDSSYDRGVPAEFPLNMVIPGWTEGLQLMSVGSKYRLYVPSEIGYGSNDNGIIPPYSTLIFEVELLEIK